MQISIQTDPDTGQVLAIYLKIGDGGRVHKTVEIAENACYADEDKKGNLLGVEMLAPGKLELNIRQVARKYHVTGMAKAIRSIKEALA